MKKMFFLVTALGLLMSACSPASLQPEAASPAPISEADLQATAALLSEQTLQALPTPTVHPSNTPVVMAVTNTETVTISPTPDSGTLTAVLTSETPGGATATGTGTQVGTSTSTATFSLTVIPGDIITQTAHPIFYGTLPPNLPSGSITIINKSKAEVYISLQCTTPDGYKTILEYPVPKTVKALAPAGKYVYVIWVGGKKLVGSFGLSKRGDVVITVFKDSVRIK